MSETPYDHVLRVVLIAASEAVCPQLVRALEGLPARSKVTRAPSLDALDAAHRSITPDLILIDAVQTGSPLPPLLAQLADWFPGAPTALLVDAHDIAAAQEALLAGAHAFIVRPITTDDLLSVLDRFHPRSNLAQGQAPAIPAPDPGPDGQPAPVSIDKPAAPPLRATPGRLTVFCAAGAGSGVTTAALNVACGLGPSAAAPVVLVDLAGGRSPLRSYLALAAPQGAAAGPSDDSLAGLTGAVLATPGLYLIAPSGLAAEATVSSLGDLRARFAHVVVDLGVVDLDPGGSPGAGHAAVLGAADLIVVTVLPELAALKPTAVLLLALRETRVDPARVWLSLNRTGMPGAISPDALLEAADLAFVAHLPDAPALCEAAAAAGLPVVACEPAAPLTLAYLDLAGQVRRLAPAYKLPARLSQAYARATMTFVDYDADAYRPGIRDRLAGALATQKGRAVVVAVALVLLAGLLGPLLTGAWLAERNTSGQQAQLPTLSGTGTAAPRVAAALVTATTVTMTPTPVNASGGTPKSPAAPVVSTVTQTPTPSRTATPVPSAAPTRTVTFTPLPTATRTPRPTATPTATATPTPTNTFTPPPTVTRPPTRPPATARPTAIRRAAPTRTPVPRLVVTPVIAAVPPALFSPQQAVTLFGTVSFSWQPIGPLPPGAAYEVVWWNSGENPAGARGIAAPTTATSLFANLDPLAAAGQFSSGQVYWTVLIVRTAPYERLSSPQVGEVRHFFYQSASVPPPSSPEPSPTPPTPK